MIRVDPNLLVSFPLETSDNIILHKMQEELNDHLTVCGKNVNEQACSTHCKSSFKNKSYKKCPKCFQKGNRKRKDKVYPEINESLHKMIGEGKTICGLSFNATQTVFADGMGFIRDPKLRLAMTSCKICFLKK